MSVTVIVPLFNVDNYRRRNLNYILPIILSKYDTILAEHSPTGAPTYIYSGPGFEKIKNINFRSDSPVICKSLLINMAADTAQTSHIWVIDADFCIPFHKIDFNTIKHHDFIQPYYYAKNLTEADTEQLITTGKLEIRYYNKPAPKVKSRHVNTYGALSFIISLNMFNKIGKMDINYTGWGYEDMDLFMRVHELKDAEIHILKNIYGVHLWHPAVKSKKDTTRKNSALFMSKGYTIGQVKNILKNKYYPDWTFDG